MGSPYYQTENERETLRETLEALAELNNKELIAYWIGQELKEAEMYHRLHKLSKEANWDERIPGLFLQLYKESLGHAETLLGMFKQMFPDERPPQVDLPALEVELSEKQLVEMIRTGELRGILKYLMGTERMARDVYHYLAERNENEDAKATLIWLANIEEGHYQKLRNVYTALFEEEPGE